MELVNRTMSYLAKLADDSVPSEKVIAARLELRDYMLGLGNTPDQAEYWIGYSEAVSEDEFLFDLLITDAAISIMQGWIVK